MKKLSLILAALLLCLPVLSSCGKDDGSGGDVTTSGTGNSNTPEVTTVAETSLVDAIPREDYQQYVYRFLYRPTSWSITQMTAEEINGESLNDLIYKRQMAVEERLNIRMEGTATGSTATALSTSVMAQSHEYDLITLATYEALSAYQKGEVVDIAKMESVDLNNPWWATSFNDTVNIGEKRYVAYGEANLEYYNGLYIYAFNKQMISDRGLENPYDLVKAGTWTWDKMYEMMQAAATDFNGDGIYNPAEDILGFTGQVNHIRNLMLSSGETITQTDGDGNPTYHGLTERYIDVFEKFMNYFVDNPIVAIASCSPNRFAGYSPTPGVDNYADVFNLGRSLFQATATYQVRTVREANMEYGLVIVPKYEASQPNYIAPVYSGVQGLAIPSTTPDLERSGVILETIGALSHGTLVDELITNVLHYKCANNPTDIEMVNLVFENGSIDIALANNFGMCANLLNSLHTYYNHNIVSTFNTMTKRFEADIAAAIADPQA